MKKSLIILGGAMLMSFAALAQTTTPTPAESPEKKQADFDKKFRFGLKIAPQPTWLKSNNDNSKGSGVNFGFGFGLMFDIKLSDIIRFSTGIGGDFEGGYVNYKYVSPLSSPSGSFEVTTVIDGENNFVEAKDGIKKDAYDLANGSTRYTLQSRRYKSTFVTIPILLKMMTQEYGGIRYFFNFGGELGIRAGLKADDTYSAGDKAEVNGTTVTLTHISEPTEIKNLNIGKDGSLIPMRVGMNLGFGIEYRLGGSTSLVTSVNYFQSFTNLMRNDSKYLVKKVESYNTTDGYKFNPLNQGYFARAIRINIGLMF